MTLTTVLHKRTLNGIYDAASHLPWCGCISRVKPLPDVAGGRRRVLFVAEEDEPLSEATLSLYLRKLVQAEIDRSFKLGLTGMGAPAASSKATSSAEPDGGRAAARRCRRE
jgi:hypothetical protein